MLTPQQATHLLAYATWAMGLVGLLSLVLSLCWGGFAVIPKNKGRRRLLLSRALLAFVLFAMFWATNASALIPLTHGRHWTPLRVVLFSLPIVVMSAGLVASVIYGIRALLRRSGRQRGKAILRSLLGIVVFSVGLAPHGVTALLPILCVEDHSNYPGTLTKIGDPAPDFELKDIDGTSFRTADLRGKVVVLNFFATWCGPCNQELPHLQAIWDEYQGHVDFRLLAVGRGETADKLRTFRRERGFSFPMAADPDASVYNRFASQSIPRTYLISRRGTILFQWTGAYEADIARLKKLLRKELAAK
jgi:peroxiredoxin